MTNLVHELIIRQATRTDIPAIVQLLQDDPLGMTRETQDLDKLDNYYQAFEWISKDLNAQLMVIEHQQRIIACAQLNILAYLTHGGRRRAQIEGVRVHKDYRGKKVGHHLIQYIIEQARSQSCVMVQLTTDKQRPDALRFYEGLGFISSHEGMKLKL